MDTLRGGRPRIREVARLAGVSVGTVSNVINHPERVSEGLRLRVEWVLEDSGFSPDPTARALSLGRSSMIGVVFFDISNPFFAEAAHQLSRRFEELGCSMVIAETDQAADVESRVLRNLERVGVDALILCSTGACWEDLVRLRDRGVPVVLMAQRSERPGFPSVGIDDYGGMRKVARHLWGRGLRRFSFVNEPVAATQHRDRWCGFSDELLSCGMAVEDVDVQWASGPTWDGGYEVARRVLAGPCDVWPDAFVCLNDHLVMGVCKAIADADLTVGRDVCVSGFDDVPYASVLGVPLTTVRQPIAGICRYIAQQIGAFFNRGGDDIGTYFRCGVDCAAIGIVVATGFMFLVCVTELGVVG
ncbi:LacI family DNA-binding transcriptional regulator [Actinomyces sp.]|uniref:LacI family DNA-binding transcriptional regulator n=1 Tax=Actinomyces sp. TaxID=29317 RepID=UPI0026DD3D16|nr:LacI family DNA-binding transcriptional regulator [Actinomyces sp.]MDO4901710.1 LacI family DNA-binding transcriptional regulator [Actinomyces sp.]